MLGSPGAWRLYALILAAGACSSGSALAGTITGTVSVGPLPSAPALSVVMTDRHVCGDEQALGPVHLDAQRRLGGAVVFIESEGRAHLPRARRRKRATVDQIGCRFEPRLLAVTSGTPIWFANSDPVFHNVHARDDERRTVANLSMPIQGQSAYAFTAKKRGKDGGPDRFTLGCDAGHTWMSADILVFRHRWFTSTDERGRFTLDQVPKGRYVVAVYHPVLGRVERAGVKVGGKGEQVTVELEY